MDPLLTGNPFGVMTFIVAPAILTNASSIMALGTSNRFAIAVDRARTLAAEIEAQQLAEDRVAALRLSHLLPAERRIRLLVRALTAFYLSAGLFAATGALALLGAVSFEAHREMLRSVAFAVVMCTGIAGVSTLVAGCGFLVWETRITLRVLAGETTFRDLFHHKPVGVSAETGTPEGNTRSHSQTN